MRLSLTIILTSLAGIAGCEEHATALALDKVPASVTAAAVAALPGFTATKATSEAEDGGISYELTGTVAGKAAKVEVDVDAKGKVVVDEAEVEVNLDQVPAESRAAALKAAPGLQITKAEREVKDGNTVWSLEGTQAGKKVEVDVKADGSTAIETEYNDRKDGQHDDKHDSKGEAKHEGIGETKSK